MQRLRWIAISIAFVLCAMNAQAADLEKPSIRLAVGGKVLVAYLPLTVAERRGYFTKEGLTVEINDFQGGSKALEALVGGSADVVCGAYEHTLYMAAKGLSIKAVALQANSFGLVVGIQKDKAAAYRSLADLKGMKIGITAPGSSTHFMALYLMSRAGLKAGDASFIGSGTGQTAVAAVRRGEIRQRRGPVLRNLCCGTGVRAPEADVHRRPLNGRPSKSTRPLDNKRQAHAPTPPVGGRADSLRIGIVEHRSH